MRPIRRLRHLATAPASAAAAFAGPTRTGWSTPKQVVLGAVVLVVVAFTVVPLAFLLWTSVWSGYPGQFDAAVTLENLVAVYGEASYDVPKLFSNSLILAVGMTVTGLAFGLAAAWLFVRTNLPTKGEMELVLLSGQAVPGYIYAIMYITAYGQENGLVSTAVTDGLGLETFPIDIFSPWGIAFIAGLNVVSTFYLLTVPAFQDMDASLEEVSRIHGANIIQTLRSTSFPLIKPAILSATLVTFLYGLGEFAVVSILGAKRGFDVYSTAIWHISTDYPPAYGHAAALSLSLLPITFVLVWYYRRVTRRKEDFMTLTGHSHRHNTWDLGRWRWPLAGVLWVGLGAVWILPILMLIITSLHASWRGQFDASQLTLANYAIAISDPRLRQAFTNSLVVAAGGATLGTMLVVGLAYYTERTRARFRGVVDFLALTPLAVPGIILGISLIFTFLWVGKLHPLVDLYGTLAIIIVGSVIVFLPVASRIALGNIVQIHSELEEAARIAGASWLEEMREVFLPLFRNTTAVIWFFLAIHLFQLLSIPLMTYSTDTVVIPVKLFQLYMFRPNLELVAAISTIFVWMTLLVLVGLRYYGITFYELDRR